jgi:import inner membrane translocase subunit TIM44
MQGYPVFKRLSGMSEPVVNKSQEIAEDVREKWETSDNPIVHKIQEYANCSLTISFLKFYLFTAA